MAFDLDGRPIIAPREWPSPSDDRPSQSKARVDLEVGALIRWHFVAGVDGVNGTFGNAQPAIDAFLWVDDQHVLALAERIDRTDFHAVGVLAEDAGLGDDVSHLGKTFAGNEIEADDELLP